MKNQRGLSAIGVVVILVVLAGGIFTALYFGTDVFRTRVDTAVRDFAKWTPENIAKRPVEYLNFCEEQTKQAAQKLKASDIGIRQKQASFESKKQECEKIVQTGQQSLSELKDAYKKAEADKKWPASWNTRSLTQDECKRQIMRTHAEVTGKQSMVSEYGKGVDQLKAQQSRVAEAMIQAEQQLAQININREKLKVQQITADLTNTLVEMKGMIGSVVSVADSGSGTVSLEEIAAQRETKIDDKEFEKILGQ